MFHTCYNVLLTSLTPFARLWLRSHARHHVLLERFAPALPEFAEDPVWIHGCSVGEINTAQPLLDGLIRRHPEWPVLLSSSTVAGMKRAEAVTMAAGATAAWFPFDTRRAVRLFLRQAHPRALVLIETELWPNVLRECQRAGIPVLLVNGRLSTRHFRRYQRFRFLFRGMFKALQVVAVQTSQYADRYQALGVPEGRIEITGSLKFDAVNTTVDPRTRARLRAMHDIAADDPVVVIGSTRAGEEALAAQVWAYLGPRFPRLRLVIAPRHIERAEEAAHCFEKGLVRRSAFLAGGKMERGHRVLLLDTIGELTQFYGLATVAVLGGSFYPGVGGHNPLEPAALGVPVLFGPHMEHFSEAVSALAAAEGSLQLADPGDLAPALERLLRDPGAVRRMGTRARMAVIQGQGATQRTLEIIDRILLPPGEAAKTADNPATS